MAEFFAHPVGAQERQMQRKVLDLNRRRNALLREAEQLYLQIEAMRNELFNRSLDRVNSRKRTSILKSIL
jgi:small-conductance mechanosensitive channel